MKKAGDGETGWSSCYRMLVAESPRSKGELPPSFFQQHFPGGLTGQGTLGLVIL